MRRKILLMLIFLFSAIGSLSAVEGLFQLNSVFMRMSYPMFGSGGKDVIRHSSAGIGIKSTRGDTIQGVIDITVLFPYKMQEKLYPAKDFSTRSVSGQPLGLDGLVGIGYNIELDPLFIFLSAGFHTGFLMEGGSTLLAFGLGIDGQAQVRLGKALTSQIGLKLSMDFTGTQSFIAGSNQFAGFPVGIGLYTGVGIQL
jgi:hypothetical protein